MSAIHASGYLTQTEASHITADAMPGAVIIDLTRNLAGETSAGKKPWTTFIELSLGEAIAHRENLDAMIRRACAMQSESMHADAYPQV